MPLQSFKARPRGVASALRGMATAGAGPVTHLISVGVQESTLHSTDSRRTTLLAAQFVVSKPTPVRVSRSPPSAPVEECETLSTRGKTRK